jgi:hypothetical protein
MDDADIPYVLQSERMGHEVPGMRGTYARIVSQSGGNPLFAESLVRVGGGGQVTGL